MKLADQVSVDILPNLYVQWEPIWNCSSLPIKFTTSITFKFTALKVTCKFSPPHKTVMNGRSSIDRSMCSVRAHLKLLKFTPQVYSSSLPVSFIPPFETVIESRSSIGWSMSAVRAHLKQLAELGHLHNSFTLCHLVLSYWRVSHTFITYPNAVDMCSWKWSNLCKFQVSVVVFVVLIISCCYLV